MSRTDNNTGINNIFQYLCLWFYSPACIDSNNSWTQAEYFVLDQIMLFKICHQDTHVTSGLQKTKANIIHREVGVFPSHFNKVSLLEPASSCRTSQVAPTFGIAGCRLDFMALQSFIRGFSFWIRKQQKTEFEKFISSFL